MSDDQRSIVFENVRQALAPLRERTPYPDYEPGQTISAPRVSGAGEWEVFQRNLEAVHGRLFRDAAELASFLKENNHLRGYCDPALEAVVAPSLRAEGLEVVTVFERADYDRLAFGITRGTAAIAESGTIVLDDHRTSDRLAALAPWVHVAVLTEGEMIPTIAEAVGKLGNSPNIIWCTGPSKTADVEGILIEGVHGPGEQIALVFPSL
jgi:L-lactate dehydrogenase complex protein LldG